MSTVRLKPLLNAKLCTFLLGDHLSLLNDDCSQCSNGTRIALVDVVLEKPRSEEIWRVQIRRVRCTFHFCLAADKMLPKHFMERRHDNSMSRSSILLELLFLLIEVPKLLELSISDRLLFCFNNSKTTCIYKSRISIR